MGGSVGSRMRERFLAIGYRQDNGEPDVLRFSFDFRFEKNLLYSWLGDRYVPHKDLVRLCRALQCSVDWLLSGEEIVMPKKATPPRGRQGGKLRSLLLALAVGGALMPSPSGGDSPQPETLRAASVIDNIRLIGRRWRSRWNSGYFGGIVYA